MPTHPEMPDTGTPRSVSSGPGGFGERTGTVVAFDTHVGIGVVAAGDAQWPFHCTTIADGSRFVDVGAEVSFTVGPAGPGRWEAFDLRA